MRIRSLLLAFLLVAGFVWVTNTRNGFVDRWIDSVRGPRISWKGQDTARSAGLSPDEVRGALTRLGPG